VVRLVLALGQHSG